MAAVAREVGVSVLVNMSQMTVSQMSIQNTTPSHQQRQHWLTEQVLSWSGLPVITIRPTMFLESLLPLTSASVRERGRIELPFGSGKTSPVAAADVARVIATVLADPGPHLGRIYELTGPRPQDMPGVAELTGGWDLPIMVFCDTTKLAVGGPKDAAGRASGSRRVARSCSGVYFRQAANLDLSGDHGSIY